MIKTVFKNNQKEFEEEVNGLLSQGYKVSSTNCGYTGEVGGNVYDTEYWVAILVKDSCNNLTRSIEDIAKICSEVFACKNCPMGNECRYMDDDYCKFQITKWLNGYEPKERN